MPKQLVKTVVALCPDQQEKCRTGKNAQKWKTEGYVCSMLSLFQFQFLYHQEKEKKKKKGNEQPCPGHILFMRIEHVCAML